MLKDKLNIYNRERKDATAIDQMASEIKKDNSNLSFSNATEEAIRDLESRKKMTTSSHRKLISEQEDSSWLKSCFYLKEWQQKTKYKSNDLWKTITEMWIETGIYQQSHTLSKHLIAIELGDKIEESELKNLPVYYLGAERDYNFPLSLRFRNIVMVDVVYDENIISQISEQLSEFSNFKIIDQQKNKIVFGFDFDFGNEEKEAVEITIIKDNIFNLPEPKEDIGAIISFFSGPSHAPAFYQKNLQKKLVNGGMLFDTDTSPLYSLALKEYGNEIFGDSGGEQNHMSYQEKIQIMHEKEKELAHEYGFNVRELEGTNYRLFTKTENKKEWLDLLEDVNK